MKYVCCKCNRLVDEKDVIMQITSGIIASDSDSYPFCRKCWNKHNK